MSYVESVGIPGLFGLTGAKTAYKDENILLGEAQAINFTGAGVAATLNAGLLTVEIDGGSGSSINVIDNLSSTSSNDALSANQGKVLKDEIDTKCPLVEGKVPSANLPSYVDDVLEYTNFASFPVTGETGKMYIAIDTNLVYRWTGSTYAVTSSSLALGSTSSTAHRGDHGAAAYAHSQATGNPHNTAIADITGLQTAIDDAAVNFAAPTVNSQTGTAYTLGTVTTDNDGKTYLRMINAAANTVTIPSTQTKPISISQRGTGTTTLAAGSGVTLNGTLAFTERHQTKTVIPLGSGVYDVVG